MNMYKVIYEISSPGQTAPVPSRFHPGRIGAVQLWAVSREHARYAAFDELHDRALSLAGMHRVDMWDDERNRWVATNEHQPVAVPS